METTDGVTSGNRFGIHPSSTELDEVRLDAQFPVLERKSAPVRLSAHALIVPDCWLLPATATEVARTAPPIKVAMYLPEFERVIVMRFILPNFAENFLPENFENF
jgi:hypothetical protein